jgi:hypothetical protein
VQSGAPQSNSINSWNFSSNSSKLYWISNLEAYRIFIQIPLQIWRGFYAESCPLFKTFKSIFYLKNLKHRMSVFSPNQFKLVWIILNKWKIILCSRAGPQWPTSHAAATTVAAVTACPRAPHRRPGPSLHAVALGQKSARYCSFISPIFEFVFLI